MGASWVDDEDFDIHHHVVREKLPRKRGQSERAGAAGAVSASWRPRRSTRRARCGSSI